MMMTVRFCIARSSACIAGERGRARARACTTGSRWCDAEEERAGHGGGRRGAKTERGPEGEKGDGEGGGAGAAWVVLLPGSLPRLETKHVHSLCIRR